MNWTFTFDDGAARVFLRFARVALDHANPFNEDMLFLADDFQDFPGGTLEVSGDDFYDIAAFDVKFLLHLENLRGERNNLHEVFLAKFAGNRSEDTGAAWVLIFINNDDRVAVEAKNRSVSAFHRMLRPNNNCSYDISLFNGTAGGCFSDIARDHIADESCFGGFSDHTNHVGHARARVVGDI